MATKISKDRWNTLKTKVKEEMTKRKYDPAPLDSYAGTNYDYSTSLSSGTKLLEEIYEKNIIPLAAANDSSLPSERDGLGKIITEADILAMETLVANLGTFTNSPQATDGGGCKASCSGYCQSSCSGSCSTGCSGGCKDNCANSCFTGCTGCTSCSGTCDGGCKGSCFATCADACFDCDCTGGCSCGCQGDNGSFCSCCYNKTASTGGTAKGAVSAGYIWFCD